MVGLLLLEQRPTAVALLSGGPWREEGRTLCFCHFPIFYEIEVQIGLKVNSTFAVHWS